MSVNNRAEAESGSGRMLVAFHEAGHAVAAASFGWPVDFIDIIPNDERAGIVRLVNEGTVPDPELDMVYSMAGPVAEAKLTQERLCIFSGDKQHFDMALEMIDCGGRNLRSVRRHYVRLTKNFVEDNWATIETVAEELILVGRMSGERLDTIIADAPHR